MKNACGKIVTAGVAGVKWQLVVVGWKHPKEMVVLRRFVVTAMTIKLRVCSSSLMSANKKK
jgi:hypothetical protein